jgi:hypothetical protein
MWLAADLLRAALFLQVLAFFKAGCKEVADLLHPPKQSNFERKAMRTPADKLRDLLSTQR